MEDRYYEQITPGLLRLWEKVVKLKPGAKIGRNKIAGILPFAWEVMPLIASRQEEILGWNIILLCDKPDNEEEIVRRGLQPLLEAKILTNEEAGRIVSRDVDGIP